jgi:enoyl-CoA hydratase
MTDTPKPRRLSAQDAISSLDSASSLTELSPLTGTAALVVDLDGAKRVRGDTVTRVRERMRELPCPTIALRRAQTRYPLEGDFDILVRDHEDLERVINAVCARPLASTALVQLLRHSEKLPVHDALIAESFVYSMLQCGPEFAAWLAAQPAREAPVPANQEPAVQMSRDGTRLDIVLNRPERHNAYSVEMRDALVEALEVAVADDSLEEVVLSGRGASFSAGGDLREFGSHPDPVTAHAVRSARNAGRLLSHCRNHVRAEVHGACIGAGAELAAFAAFVVAKPETFFQLPELSMGLIPGAGGTVSIPRRIGRQRTAYMALTGVCVESGTALEWGLVDSVRE